MEPASSLSLTFVFIFLSFVLVALNGFFVAAEFAIVKVRRSRLEELAGQGHAAARISILCVDQMDEYLSATQLGITLVSLALGWVGEESFYRLFEILFQDFSTGNESLVHGLALGLSFFIVTMLHVVLGELVPKSMAIQKAERITLVIAKPLSLFYKFAKPLIHSFTWIANLILRLIGYHGEEEAALSEEELKIVMKESHEEGVISDSEAQIIHQAFEFSDKRARDIMIPLQDVEYLSLDRTLEENLAVTQMSFFTRFPVISGSLENIVGIVHMKDVLKALSEHKSMAAIEKSLRPVIFVDPAMKQDQLMKLMNKRRTHMVVVQDPSAKKNLGLVTLEDILEHLVGEIVDEHGN
jgi:CBS domain containing-hemolysin-like protein